MKKATTRLTARKQICLQRNVNNLLKLNVSIRFHMLYQNKKIWHLTIESKQLSCSTPFFSLCFIVLILIFNLHFTLDYVPKLCFVAFPAKRSTQEKGCKYYVPKNDIGANRSKQKHLLWIRVSDRIKPKYFSF